MLSYPVLCGLFWAMLQAGVDGEGYFADVAAASFLLLGPLLGGPLQNLFALVRCFWFSYLTYSCHEASSGFKRTPPLLLYYLAQTAGSLIFFSPAFKASQGQALDDLVEDLEGERL